MLSDFPATFPAESLFSGDPFPLSETAFPPWEFDPPIFCTSEEPVTSNSHSDNSNPAPVTPDSGSERKRRISDKLSSGSDDNPVVSERKRRRMISNRESARRSRMRKQKHAENLRNKACKLKVANRDLMNQFQFVLLQNQMARTENERLRYEAVVLRQRLSDMRQVLLVRQLQQHLNPSAWPCN